MINNSDKNDDNVTLGNDNNANKEIQKNKKNTMMIILKKRKMLEINKFVKSVCFHVIPYIHSPVKGVFRIYQWQP